MSEIGKETDKELDRLLGLTQAEEPRTPNDTVCRLYIEISKGKTFRPLTSDEELELALKTGPAAQVEKTKYGEDLFKASKSLERHFQTADAEKALEKLVIFDQNSNCFVGVAAEHLFHLAINEEKQGKLNEAEAHFNKGVEETQEERRLRLEDTELPFRRGVKGIKPDINSDTDTLDDVPRDMRKAENYAALARLAKRRGFDQESAELLKRAYLKDGGNAKFLQQASDPQNFEQLYFDWTLY